MTIYGCSLEAARQINGGLPLGAPIAPATAYRQQRNKASQRGISWQITFPEWFSIWSASGLWAKRGCRRGDYCMSRHGDEGPYRADNVSIKAFVENAREAMTKNNAVMRGKL
jgi:hypothetical protein